MKQGFILPLTFLFLLISCKGINKQKQNENEGWVDLSDIQLTAFSGEQINLKQYSGKTVFINFWATWCKPCVMEMPFIKKASEKLKNEDLVFLFATDEDEELVNKFEELYGYGFNYVKVNNIEDLDVIGLPTTFIFNSSGKLEYAEVGYRHWDDQENIDLIMKIVKNK